MTDDEYTLWLMEALFLKPWELKIEQATDAMLRAGYDKLGLECMAVRLLMSKIQVTKYTKK